MAHPDEGLVRAFLDDELGEQEAEAFRSHSGGCPVCLAEIRAQEEALVQASGALLLLDTEPSLAEAQGTFQARRDAGERTEGEKSSGWGGRGSLLKAASIALLLTAGAASALPGSPVREWLAQGWNTITGNGGPDTSVQETLPPGGEEPSAESDPSAEETWASIVPGNDGVELGLFDLPENAEIRVVWVQGEQVRVFAGEGTRFRTESGRLEAHSPPGGVRVEIPNSLSQVLLTLDGKTLLRKSGSEVEILDTAQSQTPREVVFGSGLPPNEG